MDGGDGGFSLIKKSAGITKATERTEWIPMKVWK